MVKFVPLSRVDRQIALLLFALVAALYARMAAPDVLAGDSGEFQVAAWTFGLAHPTGYPTYLLLGGLWQHLLAPFGVNPAHALNLFSAVIGAAVVSLLFLLIRRWLTGSVLSARAAALFAALMLAVNPTVWSQSLLAEVYSLHALFVVLILLAAQSIELDRSGDRVVGVGRYAALFFLVGLSLTHHGMTLLLLPGLLLYLTLTEPGWWRSGPRVGFSAAALLTPLLLYLYIPLRSGAAASPWYHQRLGDGLLTIYDGGGRALLDFITGRSISVGFLGLSDAVDRLGQAALLWKVHFSWPGLVLIVVGSGLLVWRRQHALLALTLITVLLQQLFNLFYAIDDILVYYIPLYLLAMVWVGFAAHLLVAGIDASITAADQPASSGQRSPLPDAEATAQTGSTGAQQGLSLIVILVLTLLPLRLFTTYRSVLDQSGERSARAMWEAILAAAPPADAILVSNDRNEIVPLFYLQAVEGRATGLTGLFPLIRPGPRFADIGATVDAALAAGGQPVLLTKPMPGLEAKFDLAKLTPPLVRVLGAAALRPPSEPVDLGYGPLTLLGYDWLPQADRVAVRLYWRVDAPVPGDFISTVQLFAADGAKIAQGADAAPGGVYYPTSLWKVGEVLVDSHSLTLPAANSPHELLVELYTGPDVRPLAPALHLPVAAAAD